MNPDPGAHPSLKRLTRRRAKWEESAACEFWRGLPDNTRVTLLRVCFSCLELVSTIGDQQNGPVLDALEEALAQQRALIPDMQLMRAVCVEMVALYRELLLYDQDQKDEQMRQFFVRSRVK
jgi:hypothetical protein